MTITHPVGDALAPPYLPMPNRPEVFVVYPFSAIVGQAEPRLGSLIGAAGSAIEGGRRRFARVSIPGAAPVLCLAALLAAPIPAAADDGVLKTIEYSGGSPVAASYGELRFVLDQVKGEFDYFYMRARGFRGDRQVFAMQVCCNRERAVLSLLKTRHYGPAAVLQSLHGKCCADSRVALPITPARWVVREGDYSDGDKGYRFEDLDGDGAPELIGTDSHFRLLELTASRESERFAPIAIRRMNGERLVRVAADPRYRRVVADSLAALEAHPEWRNNSFLATWLATKVMLGEGQAAWARLLASYTSHLDYMCKFPMAFAPCRKEQEMMGDVPAQVRRYLLLWGYISDEKIFLLSADSAGPHP